MKLRSLVFLSAVAAGTLGAATLDSSNTLGLMKVTSDAEYTAIAVPWLQVGDGASVKVANLVKTDTLTEGDQLFVYNNGTGTYDCWALNASKQWVGAATVSEGNLTWPAGSDTATLARGKALWIKRSAASRGNPIYLYGQYAGAGATYESEIQRGTKANPAWNLIANPTAGAVDLNSLTWDYTACKNDRIVVVNAAGENVNLRLKKSMVDSVVVVQWGYDKAGTVDEETKLVSYTWETDLSTIGVGKGFWYISKSATSPAKIVWKATSK